MNDETKKVVGKLTIRKTNPEHKHARLLPRELAFDLDGYDIGHYMRRLELIMEPEKPIAAKIELYFTDVDAELPNILTEVQWVEKQEGDKTMKDVA